MLLAHLFVSFNVDDEGVCSGDQAAKFIISKGVGVDPSNLGAVGFLKKDQNPVRGVCLRHDNLAADDAIRSGPRALSEDKSEQDFTKHEIEGMIPSTVPVKEFLCICVK